MPCCFDFCDNVAKRAFDDFLLWPRGFVDDLAGRVFWVAAFLEFIDDFGDMWCAKEDDHCCLVGCEFSDAFGFRHRCSAFRAGNDDGLRNVWQG